MEFNIQRIRLKLTRVVAWRTARCQVVHLAGGQYIFSYCVAMLLI